MSEATGLFSFSARVAMSSGDWTAAAGGEVAWANPSEEQAWINTSDNAQCASLVFMRFSINFIEREPPDGKLSPRSGAKNCGRPNPESEFAWLAESRFQACLPPGLPDP